MRKKVYAEAGSEVYGFLLVTYKKPWLCTRASKSASAVWQQFSPFFF